MAKTVLLLGVTVLLLGVRADLLETVMQDLDAAGVVFLGGTSAADVGPAFRRAGIDHVIIGGGLDLEAGPRWSGRCPSPATGQRCT